MKFRYGEIDVDALGTANLEQLHSQIQHGVPKWRDIKNEDGSDGSILEVARDPHLIRDGSGTPESLYFRYVVRGVEEYQSVDDSGYDETREYEPREVTDFILTAKGNMAYESRGSPRGPLGFLLDEPNPSPMYRAGMSLPQPVLRDHYEQADRVTKVEISLDDLEPGDEPDRVGSLSEAAEEAAAFAENGMFTVGHYYETRDLRESRLIEELIDKGTISQISAVHGEESSLELSEAGWVQFHIPEDLGSRERATIIRNRVSIMF